MKYLLAIACVALSSISQAKEVSAQFQVTATIKYDCSYSKLEEMKGQPAYLKQCEASQKELASHAVITDDGTTETIEY